MIDRHDHCSPIRILTFPHEPVLTELRILHSGLSQQELCGAVFEVLANTAAATDTDADPHGWRLLALGDGPQTPWPALLEPRPLPGCRWKRCRRPVPACPPRPPTSNNARAAETGVATFGAPLGAPVGATLH